MSGKAQLGTIAPVTIRSGMRDGRASSEIPNADIARLVSEGRVVILKGVFDSAMVLDLRSALNRWWHDKPPFPHGKSPSTEPDINYHRIDDGAIPSSLPHIFHQFAFGNHGHLKQDVGGAGEVIATTMRELQNEVAGTDFDFSLTGYRLKVLHYPAGGGFLTRHSHPLEPQRVGLITSGSIIGRDFSVGGTYFVTPFGLVDTTAYHDIGDIIVFRYDLAHGVSLVDEEKNLDWNSEAGKWSIVLELRETHALSRTESSV